MSADVRIPSINKRDFLDEIAQGAKLSSSTLEEAIRAVKIAVHTKTYQQGKIIVSTSGSGQSGSFEINSLWNPVTVKGMLQEFLEILRDVKAAGAIDSADPDAIDTLYTTMCEDDRLRGIRRHMGDFSGLNFPATSLR